MILGWKKSEQMVLLDLLNASNFEFQLTGSRFFGGYTEKSDWDFFVQYSPDINEFLKNIGFNIIDISSPEWEDYQLAIEHGKCLNIYFSSDTFKSIHVQVVSNFEHKQMLQQKLFESNWMKVSDKQTRKKMWALAYSLLPEPKPEEIVIR